jgi:hypothetical protein
MMSAGSDSQFCPLEHQTLNFGLILALSSRVPPINEQRSGYLSNMIDTAEPHVGQKCRSSERPLISNLYIVSLPWIRTLSFGNTTPIRNAEPDCRWQRSHWHRPIAIGSPSYQ